MTPEVPEIRASLSKASGEPAAKRIMPKFMVRVVLHNAGNWDEYEDLHKAMEDRGFSRTLVGTKATYHLPPAEYWYKGDGTLADVRVLAAEAAELTGEPFGLIAVKADGWSVMRLKTVEGRGAGSDDKSLKPRGRRD